MPRKHPAEASPPTPPGDPPAAKASRRAAGGIVARRKTSTYNRPVKSLYEKTIAFILQYIDEHKLGAGDQLPTEAQLSSLAGVSLVTVRRALSELSSQGVVRREQGRGTFVARPRVNAETTKIGGLRHGLHLDARSKLQTRILSCGARGAGDCGSRAPRSFTGRERVGMSRLRLLNKRPMIWETSVIPKILAPDLPAD